MEIRLKFDLKIENTFVIAMRGQLVGEKET